MAVLGGVFWGVFFGGGFLGGVFFTFSKRHTPKGNRLVGLVVRRPPRERKIPGSNPTCAGIFSGSSHTSDLKIGTPVANPARRLAL